MRSRRRLSASTPGSRVGSVGSRAARRAGDRSRSPSVKASGGRLGPGLVAPGGKLRASPVADDEDRVLLRGNSRPRAADLHSPALGTSRPTTAHAHRAASILPRSGVSQALALRDEARDRRAPLGLGLAGVRIVLPDVRSHRAPLARGVWRCVGNGLALARWRFRARRARAGERAHWRCVSDPAERPTPPWAARWRARTGGGGV